MKRLVFNTAIAIALGCCPMVAVESASAETAGKRWELGFELGTAGLTNSEDELDLDLRTGVRVGYFLDDHFELELQLFQADALLDANLKGYLANLVINFGSEDRLVPYLLVGGGRAEVEDISILRLTQFSDEGPAYQAGFGVRYFWSDTLALRTELSSLWIDTETFGTSQNGSVTVGLSWSFGSRRGFGG